ncbi:MAG: tellurite resistance protein [Halobacteriovorax sp.]|nr:tellurite resistance protein [Halobacteriovorax sp.]|tara:strand:- start:112 stop:387 length:276 start_codon:yes stop_codon:yes gene_type:complete
MKSLPPNVAAYKRTDIFTKDTTPKGLLAQHRTLEGVWGKIVVLEGHLTYVIDDNDGETLELSPAQFGVVEPQVIHHVSPQNGVKFYVEFYK